jgi:hypothetical protein
MTISQKNKTDAAVPLDDSSLLSPERRAEDLRICPKFGIRAHHDPGHWIASFRVLDYNEMRSIMTQKMGITG